MITIFGRTCTPSHPYDAAVGQWLAGTEDERAMARNIMHDHRVSPEREMDFDEYCGSPRTSMDLQAGLVNYFRERVRFNTHPAFMDVALNGHNLVLGDGKTLDFEPTEVLVRALSLNGLREVFRWGRDQGFAAFRDLSDNPSPLVFNKWLDDRLLHASTNEAAQLVGGVIEVMNAHRQAKGAFQPTWATTLSALKPFIADGPNSWLDRVGVTYGDTSSWIVLLGYPASSVPALVRPTQLDAGWSTFHFPSPPSAMPVAGGHPVDLGSTAAPSLLPEYIHPQMDHVLDHFTSVGSRVGRIVALPRKPDLMALRARHLQRLVGNYGPEILQWMPCAQ